MTYYLAAKISLALAATAALYAARRDRRHAPIAFALGATLALDLVRLRWQLGWPPRLALAAYLLPSGIAAWVALRVFCVRRAEVLAGLATAPLCAFALLAPSPASWWYALPAAAIGMSLLLQNYAALRFYSRGLGESGTAQRTALVLLAGDLCALVLGRLHPEALPAQAVAVYLFLIPVQLLVPTRRRSGDPRGTIRPDVA